MQNLINKIENILEEENIKETDVLEDFEEWDSLAIITLIAFIDKEYKVNLYSSDFKSIKTVGELIKLIEQKRG